MRLNEITKIVREKLGVYYNHDKVCRQLNEMKKRYSDEEIIDRLNFWYDYNNGDPSQSNGGIAIITYIDKDYYEWKKKQEDIERKKEKLKGFSIDNDDPPEIVEINIDRKIKPPTRNY